MDAKNVDVLAVMSVSSLLISNLPELPGYNGSIRTIDDEEAERVGRDLDAAHDAVAELIESASAIWLDYDGDLAFISGLDRLRNALARIGAPA